MTLPEMCGCFGAVLGLAAGSIFGVVMGFRFVEVLGCGFIGFLAGWLSGVGTAYLIVLWESRGKG